MSELQPGLYTITETIPDILVKWAEMQPVGSVCIVETDSDHDLFRHEPPQHYGLYECGHCLDSIQMEKYGSRRTQVGELDV